MFVDCFAYNPKVERDVNFKDIRFAGMNTPSDVNWVTREFPDEMTRN